jgi:hypothetical protein
MIENFVRRGGSSRSRRKRTYLGKVYPTVEEKNKAKAIKEKSCKLYNECLDFKKKNCKNLKTQANTTQANTTQANTTQANTTQANTTQANTTQANIDSFTCETDCTSLLQDPATVKNCKKKDPLPWWIVLIILVPLFLLIGGIFYAVVKK